MRRIAIIQKEAIRNSLDASIEIMLESIHESAENGAKIVAFGESWLCGYPAWIDYCSGVAQWDNSDVKLAWSEMYQNAISLHSPYLKKIKDAAKSHNLIVLFGCNEKIETGKGNSSLYNSIMTIDQQGKLVHHHRKLMPTYNEKLIHALGDGAGLHAIDTELGRIGSLICWEHWMPLARQAMHDQAEDIHFALWPHVIDRHLLASRHYAFEGRCYVIAVGQILQTKNFPETMKIPDGLRDQDYVLKGGSCLIGPDGSLLTEQIFSESRIIYMEIPSEKDLIQERMNLAVSGHYQREDVFDFNVNKKRKVK